MIRLMIYFLLIAVVLFLALRQLEFMVTYHPAPYSPGPQWTLPPNGEDVWIAVAGNQRLHGWFVKSPSRPAMATILYCHGNGGNLTNVGWIAEELAKRGFDVLAFDYRGYGRSEGKLTDESGLYADAGAVYDHLTRQRGVQPERLAIYGLSLGTTAAIDLASRRAAAALVVESGLSSASEMGAVAFPWLPRWLYFLAKNRFESARKIADVNCPVLVTHGTRDDIIPVEQGRKLYESAREPKQLIIVEGGDHNLAGNGGDPYLEQIAGFIRDAIKP